MKRVLGMHYGTFPALNGTPGALRMSLRARRDGVEVEELAPGGHAFVTFSLVASDVEAGQWGVVVASKFLAVGAVVPWAAAGTGAVATQALAKVGFGPGRPDPAAGGPQRPGGRREAARSRSGRRRSAGWASSMPPGASAAFTGEACVDWAGHRTGHQLRRSGQPAGGAGGDRRRRRDVRTHRGAVGGADAGRTGGGDAAGGDRRGVSRRAWSCASTAAATAATTSTRSTFGSTTIPSPIEELQRLYAIHDLLFGSTPAEQLLPLEQVESELSERLAALGFTGTARSALEQWADIENLEERLHGDRIDPVVLRQLRRQTDE